MYKNILVGIDGSEASVKAAKKALDLAKELDAAVTFLTVVPPPTVLFGELLTPEVIDISPLVKAARESLESLKKRLQKEGIKINVEVLIGEPSEVIVDYAESGEFDLIVLGRSGMSRIERLFIGSVTKKVLERAKSDVLVVV